MRRTEPLKRRVSKGRSYLHYHHGRRDYQIVEKDREIERSEDRGNLAMGLKSWQVRDWQESPDGLLNRQHVYVFHCCIT